MNFGALKFEVWPFNPTATSSESGGEYVEKPIMGRRPPLEFVGEAAENFTISVKLFPAKRYAPISHAWRRCSSRMVRGDERWGFKLLPRCEGRRASDRR